MSGVGEAGAVLGLISSVLTILDAVKEVYDTASDAKGLSKKLRTSAEQIPLVKDALSLAAQNIKDQQVSGSELQSAQNVLEQCQERATSVKNIFDKTKPAANASKPERMKKAFELNRKSKEVKENMEELVKDVALLGQYQVFQDAVTLKRIREAVEQLEKLPDEEKRPQFIADNIYANTGSSEQYHVSGDQYRFDGGTQYFGSLPDPKGHELLNENVKLQQDILEFCLSVAENENMQKLSDEDYACHRTFADRNYRSYKDDIIDAVSGTCQWLLRDSKYQSWRDNKQDSVLWLTADPGCGKSVLCKMLIDKELPAISYRGRVCYFFFNERENQDHLNFALCSILHQLFDQQPALLQLAIPVWRQHRDQIRVETQVMLDLLRDLAADTMAKPIVCVLDALDECREADHKQLVSFLCDVYRNPSSNGTLKIFVTSRPYLKLEQQLGRSAAKMSRFQIQAENYDKDIREEIALVIDHNVAQLGAEVHLSDYQQYNLQQKFLQMENRTYLWLHLALEEVREAYEDCLIPEDVEIENLPTSVNKAYERILQKIKRKPKAINTLSIIVAARRPLAIGEMALALNTLEGSSTEVLTSQNISHLGEKIRRWCGFMVYIKNSKIFLQHHTVKEYLLANSSDILQKPHTWESCLDKTQTERLMGRVCVEYLCLKQIGMQHWKDRPEVDVNEQQQSSLFGTRPERITFFKYCAEQWTSYLTDRDLAEDMNLIDKVVTLHDEKDVYFNAWHPIMLRVLMPFGVPIGVLGQHTLARNGYLSVLKRLWERVGFNVDQKDSNGKTALSWAIEGGQVATVKWLLQAGANVYVRVDHFESALHAAIQRGDLEIVTLLLQNGARIDETSADEGNALHTAAIHGQETIFRALFVPSANVNAFCDRYGSILQAASANGNQRIVQILLDANADVNVRGGRYGSALNAACAEGHEAIVELLLNAGADINADIAQNGNALLTATKRGNEKLVNMLFQKGIRITSNKRMYSNALCKACERGRTSIVKMLLDMGADMDSPGLHYSSVLEAASTSGSFDLVFMLLNRGATADFSHPKYGAALQIATYRRHINIIMALLNYGVNVNSPAPYFGTVLYTSLERGYQEITEIFLEVGADVNASHGKRGSALYRAAERGQYHIVLKLLNERADPNIRGGYYGTPLQAAACYGHLSVVRLLISRGANVNVGGGYFGCSLSAAAYAGNWEIVRELLLVGSFKPVPLKPEEALYFNEHQRMKIIMNEARAILSPRGGKGQRLQSALNARTRKTAIKNLTKFYRGPDFSDWYGSPLQAAAARGHSRIVTSLLNYGAEVNDHGGWYGTALQAASYSGKREHVEALVNRGADVFAVGGAFGNALQAASYGGNEEVVRYLLAKGCDPNTTGGWFGCALQAAAAHGHCEIVRALLENGADPNVQGGWHSNALQAAEAGDHEEVESLLRSKMSSAEHTRNTP